MVTKFRLPNSPFNKVGTDILEYKGLSYLLVIDYDSKFIDVKQLRNKSSYEIIKSWAEIFSRWGIPKIVIGDNNPFNSHECREFSRRLNFEIKTSSPHYPKGKKYSKKQKISNKYKAVY